MLNQEARRSLAGTSKTGGVVGDQGYYLAAIRAVETRAHDFHREAAGLVRVRGKKGQRRLLAIYYIANWGVLWSERLTKRTVECSYAPQN